MGLEDNVWLHSTAFDRITQKSTLVIGLCLDCFINRCCWINFSLFGLISRRVADQGSNVVRQFRGQGVPLRFGKMDRWYRRVWMYSPKIQPSQVSSTKVPFYHGTPHPLLSLHTDECPTPASSPIVLGNLNVLSACPFILWHNVACNGWPPLWLLDTLLTVSPSVYMM